VARASREAARTGEDEEEAGFALGSALVEEDIARLSLDGLSHTRLAGTLLARRASRMTGARIAALRTTGRSGEEEAARAPSFGAAADCRRTAEAWFSGVGRRGAALAGPRLATAAERMVRTGGGASASAATGAVGAGEGAGRRGRSAAANELGADATAGLNSDVAAEAPAPRGVAGG
jgi:hypothetical protein